jgi:hypothetical protein
MFIFFNSPPGGLTLSSAGLKKEKKALGEKLPALTPVPDGVEVGRNAANLSRQFAAGANRRFKFQKRRQLFIRMNNETLSVVAMCISNPDRSPARIHS